ncbi:PD-(D/E)XK nuclease family protein [Halomonas sp. DP1Y21-3]|uniref:PDDEXK-like family protein n=1 Tax=Halomonas sp. DP1Y21-3 TaxID=2859080 RepID=UPI001C93FD7E|nr:PD-(D/E)XK nuclease family protein [Halomonas sp. DP1Y21-3]MBY6112528.1 PD-(D/E)XK nuclease family protein [Halomonas sp. DP1Y21-3]
MPHENKEPSLDDEHRALEALFERMEQMPPPAPPEPNLFSISGPGQHENRLSDLMAIFMGSHEGAPRWLAKALVACLLKKGAFPGELEDDLLLCTDWDSLSVEREVPSPDVRDGNDKRLDLVISSDSFVIGIEHKVWASASYNPFTTYAAMIDAYQQPYQVRCVLSPLTQRDDVPVDWVCVSYDELITAARERFGEEVATSTFTKWQVFYQELLQHLHAIAHQDKAMIMDDKELTFALKHFAQLKQAARKLGLLESELVQQCTRTLASTLDISENEIIKSSSTWRDEQRVLRFSCPHWEGHNNQACLVYYPTSESDAADSESIGFYVRGYIDRQATSADLEDIAEDFMSTVPDTCSDACSFYRDGEPKDFRFESNKRYLVLDAWPHPYTREGALNALGDLARWIDQRLSQSVQ